MNTQEKCEAILKEIVRRCDDNRGTEPDEPVISFAQDWGGNSITLYVDGSHTHMGSHEGTFDQLINGLHDFLLEGKGLSLAIPISEKDAPLV